MITTGIFGELELVFINSASVNNNQKNKMLLVIVFLLFSLVSLYMPHGLVETYEHHDYETSAKIVIKSNKFKLSEKLRKILKILKPFLHKLFRLPQTLSNIVVLVNIRAILFKIRFIKVSILDLFSFLCFYFHGSKYKNRMIILSSG